MRTQRTSRCAIHHAIHLHNTFCTHRSDRFRRRHRNGALKGVDEELCLRGSDRGLALQRRLVHRHVHAVGLDDAHFYRYM